MRLRLFGDELVMMRDDQSFLDVTRDTLELSPTLVVDL